MTKLIAAAGLVFALVAPVSAGPAIDWDPVFFYGTGITPTNSPLNAVLVGVGTVSNFGPPLEFLNPFIGPNEYTIYVYGLESQGTSAGPFYVTNYSNGFIEIREDTTPDASYDANPPNAGVPSDFQDGTLILSGNFTSFFTQINGLSTFNTGNAEGVIQWTGGTLLPYTGPGGEPCPGLFTGGLTYYPPVMADTPGYVYRHDGKIDFNCPTPTQSGTWGKVKSSYR